MDYITFWLLLLLLLPLLWAFAHVLNFSPFPQKYSAKARLPPGPRPLPIVGNLFKLRDQPHKSLADLSKIYGPIMFLKLGSIPTIIISSSKTAQQVLQKNDQPLSNRIVPDAVRALDHHQNSMMWLPASARWRNIRKTMIMHFFSLQRLDATQALRRTKVQELLDHAHQSCSRGEAVNIGRAAFATSLNLLSNTVFSTDLVHHDSKLSQEIKDIVWGVMEEIGRLNVADYFPVFRLLDPQGIRRAMKIYFTKLSDIFYGIIDQRLKSEASSAASNDVLDALLNLTKEDNHEWSFSDTIHLLLDTFLAGTDTTSSTVEWAMAELISNPKTMAKARRELQEVLGKDGIVQESDISKLPYLQSIVKETLRLHPPAPLLLPHKAQADVEICGFTVPKNSQVLVNAWAIGRDPNTWTNPNAFVPERFQGSKIDVKGRDFEVIPFGSGRRMCPGMPLADRMVHLMLASLLHSFDWKLEDGLKPEDMDMSEKFGITLQKAKPLRAIPIRI